MKALFGAVSLLVALAIVGIVAVKQMKAVSSVPSVSTAPAPTGNVREQSRQVQQQVATDVQKALQQGADARKDADQ